MPLPATIHPSITAIVRRALSFSADQRFATAADLRDAIDRAMVSAQCVTTAADIAAFVAEHLADRIDKRRAAIDAALADAAERERLTPPDDRRSQSMAPGAYPSFQTGSPPWPPPSSGMLPSTVPEHPRPRTGAPPARPSLAALARRAPRVSESPHASSYATLGSAALDADVQQAKGRKGVVAVVSALVVAAAVAAVVSLGLFRPHSSAIASAPAQAAATPVLVAKTAPPRPPTIAASSLPRAASAPAPSPAPAPPRRVPAWQAGPRPRATAEPEPASETAPMPTPTPSPAPPPTPSPAKPAGSVDDGF
jgi:hypothetical protein